jgi:hypothetical protein
MNLRRFQIGLLALLLLVSVRAAVAQTDNRPFEPGEELTYKAEVSRSLLKKIDVATFKFLVAPSPARAHSRPNEVSPPLNFIGDVASEGFFTKLFNLKFHQHVESTVDADSLAVKRTVKLDEQGKRIRTSEASFDQKTGKVVWTERDPNNPTRTERTLSADFTGTVQDVVSAIYYLRTQKLEPGVSLQLEISDSGRVYKIPVRVVERRRLKTILGKVDAIHIEPQLFGEGGMVNTKGQFSIWLTDDYRHIPVKAQLKGDFGTFDITLKQVSRLSPPRK